jgi:hypothetical protein
MTVTIDLSPEEEARLAAASKERGLAPHELAKRIVVERLSVGGGATFAEILAPVHAHTHEQGHTDEEVGEFADAEVAAYRAERLAKRQSIKHQ